MAKGKSKEMGVVMRYEAGRKNRRVGKKLTLCEQRGELFSWGAPFWGECRRRRDAWLSEKERKEAGNE